MREVVYLCALLMVGVVACDSKKTPFAEPAKSASAVAPTSVVSSRAPSASSAAASAPAPSASAALGPCPPNAKRYDEPKFCVVLPEKTLDISYEGGAEEGTIELHDKSGSVIRFSWVPVARLGNESIKAQLERVKPGEELVGSGDIPRGAWSDVRKVDGEQKGEHVVQSVTKTQKLLINCHYTVEEARSEPARAVCKSVRAY